MTMTLKNDRGVTVTVGRTYDIGYGDKITVRHFEDKDGLPIVVGTRKDSGGDSYDGWAWLNDCR